MTETEKKIDKCFDILVKYNCHLQTYIRRSIVVNNDKLREYAKRAVLRKARHIVKLSEIIRYYQDEYYRQGGK